jgi:hypothetical protein
MRKKVNRPRNRARPPAKNEQHKKPLWRKPITWCGTAGTAIVTSVAASLISNHLGTQNTSATAASPASHAPVSPGSFTATSTTPTPVYSNTNRKSTHSSIKTSPSPSPIATNPMTVVSEDPIGLDEAGEWVFPGKVTLTSAQLRILNTDPGMTPPAFMNLLFSLGAYEVYPDTQLVVQNNNPEEIRILNANVVKSCQPPLTGTLIYSPDAGADPTVQLGFDLDSLDTEAKTSDIAGVHQPDYFDQHTVTIKPGAQQVFNIKAVTARQACSFRFLFTLLIGSRKTSQLIGDGSQPFRESASIITRSIHPFTHYAAMYAGGVASPPGNQDKFVSVDPQEFTP